MGSKTNIICTLIRVYMGVVITDSLGKAKIMVNITLIVKN